MWSSQQRSLLTMRRGLVATRSLAPQVQPFFLVNAVSSFVIVTPAFTPQQDVNAREAIAHARLGDLLHPLPHRPIVARLVQVTIDRAMQKYRRTRASLRDPILRQQHSCQLPALAGLQSFFLSTSCSICLSSVRSATIRFNCAFSSSSWRKRRNSTGPNPLYFFFHA